MKNNWIRTPQQITKKRKPQTEGRARKQARSPEKIWRNSWRIEKDASSPGCEYQTIWGGDRKP